AGILAHRPEAAAVHVGLAAAGEGRRAGDPEIALGVEAEGLEVVGTVERLRVGVAREVGDARARRFLRLVRAEGALEPLAAKAGVHRRSCLVGGAPAAISARGPAAKDPLEGYPGGARELLQALRGVLVDRAVGQNNRDGAALGVHRRERHLLPGA